MAISTLGPGGSGQERYRSNKESRLESMRYRWALLLRAERDGGGGVDAIFFTEVDSFFFLYNGRKIVDMWCLCGRMR